MSDSEVTAQTRKFYERYRFPGNRPIDRDGLVFFRHFASTLAEVAAKNGADRIRVLDAGCGTGNTSVALARRFKEVQFLGIDQSRNSLRHARSVALEEGLQNLRFRGWNLLSPLPKMKPFDVILCLGVLHHTADMRKVLVNLGRVLKTHGVMFLWIYGRLGRYRHMLNVRALQYLVKSNRNKEALNIATEFVRRAGKGCVIPELLGKTPTNEMQQKALVDPVWIVDQFLNPHEKLLDMEGLLGLVKSAGFAICCDIGRTGEVAELLNSPLLLERWRRLEEKEQLIVCDLITKPERYFVKLLKKPQATG